MSISKDRIKAIEKTKEYLTKGYKTTKFSVFKYEAESGDYAIPALIELRDAFDHVNELLTNDEFERQPENIYEHVRRAGVESLELLAESKMKDIRQRIEKNLFLKNLIIFDKRKLIVYKKRFKSLQGLLIKLRENKTSKDWEKSIEIANEIVTRCESLDKELPSLNEIKWKKGLFYGGVVGTIIAIIGIVLTIVSMIE